MKRFFALLMVAIMAMTTVQTMAAVVTPEAAKSMADELLACDEWAAGDATVTLVEKDGVPAYYVIEYNEGGWALVSAQSNLKPLIGYNLTGEYATPEPMKVMLDYRAEHIVKNAVADNRTDHMGWRGASAKVVANATPSISPLIPLNLNQRAPYNKYCPSLPNGETLVGCVAVAMTQAMATICYPDCAVGYNRYTHSELGTLSINFDDEAPYNWDAVLASDKTGNYDEVARILYHAGMAVDMIYSTTFSGAYDVYVAPAFIEHFKFDKTRIRQVYREQFSTERWLELLIGEFSAGRVVTYSGASGYDAQNKVYTGGHCWNIDGWNYDTQMVHVNWGWGGVGNGYFDIDNMSDQYQGISFPYLNSAVVGIGGPTTAPYGLSLSTTTFTAGTAAGVALADVNVVCDDEQGSFTFTTKGAVDIWGDYSVSPYEVVDGKLVSTQTVEDNSDFTFVIIGVTNVRTGESFEKSFSITIEDNDAVENVVNDAMKVYPSVVADYINVEVPMVGGSYAIYSTTGAMVAQGTLDGYATQVSVEALTAGSYIIRYVHEGGVGVKTFIKR